MRHLKMSLSALAMAAAIALTGASVASATALWEGSNKLFVGSLIDFSLAGLTVAKLTNTAGTEVLDECSVSTVRGTISNAGGSGVAVKGNIGSITWEGCTVPTTTDTKGSLEVTQIGSSTDGTVKATGEIGVTINTIFFGLCQYGVKAGAHLGVLKTSSSGVAVFTANATAVKLSGSNFVCPETTKWVATYYNTVNSNLRVEAT
jgi:hypothetical protein